MPCLAFALNTFIFDLGKLISHWQRQLKFDKYQSTMGFEPRWAFPQNFNLTLTHILLSETLHHNQYWQLPNVSLHIENDKKSSKIPFYTYDILILTSKYLRPKTVFFLQIWLMTYFSLLLLKCLFQHKITLFAGHIFTIISVPNLYHKQKFSQHRPPIL